MGLLDNQTQATYYGGSSFGTYQFVTLSDIINAFEVIYVGEGKLIDKVNRLDISFHAQRALQELSFDTLKSIKSQEIELPPSLQMVLPQDYVNYVKITRADDAGIERIIYPAIHTSNPTAISQDDNGDYQFTSTDLTLQAESNTWTNYKASSPHEDNLDDFTYDDDRYDFINGQRFGLNPQQAQVNGSFYIDENAGKIHFSSNLSGKIITLKYISDGLGTEDEMKVHKFAEEAMYKHIAYSIVSNKIPFPEYVVQRLRKEKIAATRKAKLRLSNIKLEEIVQVLRGKSKHIKH
tara:strand:- start:761 stop:1639 length:879 start_codon:yes stop_codon:yes gene_type:complete